MRGPRFRHEEPGLADIELLEDRLYGFNVQAPGLYEKLGFQIVSELPDFPLGHPQILLRKRLQRRND